MFQTNFVPIFFNFFLIFIFYLFIFFFFLIKFYRMGTFLDLVSYVPNEMAIVLHTEQ